MQVLNTSAVKRFDLPLELDQQRLAIAVQRFACGHFDPAFADAVFLDVGAVFAVEADADVVLEHGAVVKRAARVNGQVIGQFGALGGFGHGGWGCDGKTRPDFPPFTPLPRRAVCLEVAQSPVLKMQGVRWALLLSALQHRPVLRLFCS
jgi:hypothetical protein